MRIKEHDSDIRKKNASPSVISEYIDLTLTTTSNGTLLRLSTMNGHIKKD